jgi:hypothetical protein
VGSVLAAARCQRSTCTNLPPPRVFVLVIPLLREVDLVGIVDVFAMANVFLPSDQYPLELVTWDFEPRLAQELLGGATVSPPSKIVSDDAGHRRYNESSRHGDIEASESFLPK